MTNLLSKLVENLAEGIHKIKYNDCDCFLEYKSDNFSNNNNKFILLLRKGVYFYEYMDELEKFNETILPEKE